MFTKHTSSMVGMAIVAVMALLVSTQTANAMAKKVLPAAISSAFQKSYPAAKILAWSTEKDNGVLCYEVESMDGKTRRDLIYSADGVAQEIEELIQPSDLPAAVSSALLKAYPGETVKTAEKLTRGTFSGFEVVVVQGKTSSTVVIDNAGTIQKAPAESDDD
jgi:hypothetical protein